MDKILKELVYEFDSMSLARQLQKLYNIGYSLGDLAKVLQMPKSSLFRLFKKLKIQTEPKRRKWGADCHLWKGK